MIITYNHQNANNWVPKDPLLSDNYGTMIDKCEGDDNHHNPGSDWGLDV